MTDLASIGLSLLPDLLLLALGGLIRAWLPANAWAGLDRLNFLVLFPALLFVSACARPIALSAIASVGTVVWTVMGLGFGLGLLLRRWGPTSFLDFAGA